MAVVAAAEIIFKLPYILSKKLAIVAHIVLKGDSNMRGFY